MAIASYSDLQQAISDNLARSDLASFAPDFITMAENWMNYGSATVSPLRCREMEAIVSLVPVSGVCTLPTDYLEYRRVSEATSYRRTLDYVTLDEAERLYPNGLAGLGERFTIVGSSLYTFPSVSNNVSLVYYQAIPALSNANPTNWLLTKAPGLYLRAALAQAADYIKDDNELTKQASLAGSLIAGMNHSDMLGRFSRAGVTLRGVTP
jgi:hypothetical protein